jgi:hypothetical protein
VVNDVEFHIMRDSFAVACDDLRTINRWHDRESFQSQWNAGNTLGAK